MKADWVGEARRAEAGRDQAMEGLNVLLCNPKGHQEPLKFPPPLLPPSFHKSL